MSFDESMPTLLLKCTDQELIGVFRWFNSEKAVLYWGGPDITYPLQIKRFKTESKYEKSQSYVLKQGRKLLAFGQVYNRLDHCHLGRLVVSPKFRGKGVGSELIRQLIATGKQSLGLYQASLFVLGNNKSALNLYRKMGFVVTEYPKETPLENCLYMRQSEKQE